MTDKKPTMLRLPEETVQKIKFLANVEHRSMNMEIEHILNVYIDSYEKDNGVISVTIDSEE